MRSPSVEPANAAWDADKAAAARFGSQLKGRFGSRVEHEAVGGTVMHLAASAGACNSLTELLKAGGDFTLLDSHHRTPLFYAAKGGHTNAARILLEGALLRWGCQSYLTRSHARCAAGAKVDAADNNGLTPLMAASAMGHTDAVTLLLNNGASLMYSSGEGYTPVHAAAQGGHAAVVKLLAERGALLERVTTDTGHTALHIAARFGCVAAALSLLALGARPGARTLDGGRVLHVACAEAQPAVLRELLARPEIAADLDKADFNGHLPLHTAVVAAATDCFALLLPLHAPASATAAGNSRLSIDSPTHLAAKTATRSVSAAVAGKTALHLAAERGLDAFAAALLKAGASAAARDEDCRAPLHYAAMYGHVSLMRLLVSAGCGVDCVDDGGRTPLYMAAKRGCARTAEALVALGADGGVAAADGSSPCSVAREEHKEKSRLAVALSLQRRLLEAPPPADSPALAEVQ